MVSWRCGHRRAPGPWSDFGDDALDYWAVYAASATARYDIAAELKLRRRKCPACSEQDRRARNHWAALALVAALLLLVAWRCA